ncbi:zinc ribbon domain-containing protein [bacterium]|nr:zinc ribbon domain-containing protein [bacterium]
MPIYEYACRDCGYELEALQKLSEPPLTDCPDCHATALVKKVSAAAFRLSGGGWYETDFKKDGKRNLAGDKSPDKPASDTTGKTESKTDTTSKPDKASASKPSTSKGSAA